MKRKPVKPADNSRRLTYGEAATMLKVSIRTVRRYAISGRLERIYVTKKNIYVTEGSVRKLIGVRP